MAKPIQATTLPDEELVTLITNSNQELYIHIVERYQAPLLRYAGRLVFDEEAAQDVIHVTFIKAYQNLRSFKTNLKFSSWIYRIAHNESMNWLKKHKKEFKPDDETWFDRVADDRPSIIEELDGQLSRKQVVVALQELDGKYRDPLVLHFFEGKSYQEISDILRIPSPTVGTRINRAKQKLKSKLEQKGVHHG